MDLQIARDDQLAQRQRPETRSWKFFSPCEGRLEPWPPQMPQEGGRRQAHAHRGDVFIVRQFTDVSGQVWYYRRQTDVTRRMARAERSAGGGLPDIVPELALLFKSMNNTGRERSQDQADFDRGWLRRALTATNPEQRWIERLG